MAGAPGISRYRAEAILAEAPFAPWWGFQVESVEAGCAVVRLPFQAHFVRPGGTLQGACSMALADVAFWLALMSVVGEEQMAVTLEMKTNFLKGARGDLRCEARVLKAGRRIGYGDAATHDAQRALVAHHTLTYLRP